MRVLRLTSPNMKGQDVKAAQKAIKTFCHYPVKIDGVYGERTASAVRDIKWSLGYRQKNINSVYDTKFQSFITGKQKPNLLMRQRAKARKNNKGLRAIEVGRQFIGVSEHPPGSNQVMFSRWYGIIGPWCAMFVSYCFVQAKSSAFQKGSRYAYCPFVLADAKAHQNHLTTIPKNMVRAGDIVLYDWNDDGTADHIGIVTSTVSKSGDFTALEGNTSGNNPSDGGMVSEGPRNTRDVIAFVRVLA